MDGADWEQGFTDYHCPQAVRILDFPHAAEHVNCIGEFLHGEYTPKNQAWLGEHLHRLKHEGPDKLLLEFLKLQRKYPQVKPSLPIWPTWKNEDGNAVSAFSSPKLADWARLLSEYWG